MKSLPLTVIYFLLASCGSNSSPPSRPTSQPPAPPAQDIVIQYGSPLVFTVNQPAEAVPYISDGNASPVTIEPSLPEGLTLDTMTGLISGTPAMVTPAAIYTVDAGNRLDGIGRTTVVIEVNDGPLFYPTPITAHLGSTLAPVVPRGTVTLTKFSVNPDLPAGLNLDPANGAISGTPTIAQPPTHFEITGSESQLTTVFGIDVGVIDPSASTSIEVPPRSTPQCVFSGLFVGSYWVEGQPLKEGTIVVLFTPDGNSRAIVDDVGANTAYASDGTAGLSLSGSFQFNFSSPDTVSLSGNFFGEDHLSGIYTNSGVPISFMAARIGGASSANIRYTSKFTYSSDVEFAVLDRTGNGGSGVGYEFEATSNGVYSRNVQFSINAIFDPTSSTYSWQVPAISESGKNTVPASGLDLSLGSAYDDSLDLSLVGCRLN